MRFLHGEEAGITADLTQLEESTEKTIRLFARPCAAMVCRTRLSMVARTVS